MKKVMIFGIFDGAHDDHKEVLEEAKTKGDHLTAVVAQDHVVEHLLGRLPAVDFAERFEQLKEEDGVDKVVIGDSEFGTKRIVAKYEPDVVVFGRSQELFKHDLEFNIKDIKKKPEVILLKATEVHTSKQ